MTGLLTHTPRPNPLRWRKANRGGIDNDREANPADELAAVTTAIRRLIEDDKYPHAPRLDPLRAALARLEAASKPKREQIGRICRFEPEGPAASQSRQARAAITGGRIYSSCMNTWEAAVNFTAQQRQISRMREKTLNPIGRKEDP
jgi:hypothetical protein